MHALQALAYFFVGLMVAGGFVSWAFVFVNLLIVRCHWKVRDGVSWNLGSYQDEFLDDIGRRAKRRMHMAFAAFLLFGSLPFSSAPWRISSGRFLSVSDVVEPLFCALIFTPYRIA
jgi:hypothetical protein